MENYYKNTLEYAFDYILDVINDTCISISRSDNFTGIKPQKLIRKSFESNTTFTSNDGRI